MAGALTFPCRSIAATQHSVPAGLVLQLVEVVEAHWNVPPDALLSPFFVDIDSLRDELARFPLDSFLRIVERARMLTGEPGLGFRIGLQARVSAFGHLGFAAMSAGTVREAIAIAARFAPLISTALGLRLRVEGELASLIIEEYADFGDVRDIVVIGRLAALWRTALALTGQDLRGTAEMAIPAPDYHSRFAHLVPPTRYGQPTTRILLPARALDVPLIMGDPAALKVALRHCDKALEALIPGASLVHEVRELLWKPQGGFRSLDEIARAVHMSPSTLQRKLALHRYSAGMLLEEERRDRALLLLRTPASIERIAARLGYSGALCFSRSFRRWTGTTPAAYRRTDG
jgi:AraC-like DNA-binding protein